MAPPLGTLAKGTPRAPESPLHPILIKAADFDGLSNHNTPEKKGVDEVGVGYFQSVLLVARTFDSQITAWAHLCRLCFLKRSLTPGSCVGCLPDPNAWTFFLSSPLFPEGRFQTLALGQALSDLEVGP